MEKLDGKVFLEGKTLFFKGKESRSHLLGSVGTFLQCKMQHVKPRDRAA